MTEGKVKGRIHLRRALGVVYVNGVGPKRSVVLVHGLFGKQQISNGSESIRRCRFALSGSVIGFSFPCF